MDRIDLIETKWENGPNQTKVDQMTRIGLTWIKMDRMDRIGPMWTEWTAVDLSGQNRTNVDRIEPM